MFFSKGIKRDMTKFMNNFSYYFLNPIILLISLGISGCIFDNRAHSPPITGDIEISKDSKGGLCFMPLLASATFMEEVKFKEYKYGVSYYFRP